MAITRLDRAVYPKQARPLKQHVAQYLDAAQPASIQGDIFALVAPNTNLISGGRVAAEVFKSLENCAYDTVVFIAPSRHQSFPRINISKVDAYHTPLGSLAVNDKMRHELCDEDDDIYLDDSGHFNGAGIDVQLPFIQMMLDTFDIVPVVMGDESPEFCRELGHAIGEITYNQRALVVASADVVAASDEALAEFKTCFEAADVSRLMMLFNSERVKVKGKGPILVAMIAALHRRIGNARVLTLEAARPDTPGYIGAVLWG